MARLRSCLMAVAGAVLLAAQALAEDSPMQLFGVDAKLLEGVDSPKTYYSERHDCPLPCERLPPSNWTVYSSFPRMRYCEEPMLFDFSLENPVADPNTPTKLRVCVAGSPKLASRDEDSKKKCQGIREAAAANKEQVTMDYSHGGIGSGERNQEATTAIRGALKELVSYFDDGRAECEETAMFAYQNTTIAGVYLGKSMGKDTVASLATQLLSQMESSGAHTQVLQLCGERRNAHHVVGLVVDTAGNITAVQDAVKGWNEAKCLGYEYQTKVQGVTIWEDTSDMKPSGNFTFSNSTSNANTTFVRRWRENHHLSARADCRVESIVAGDGCWSIAQRCGISELDLGRYNPGSDFCNKLQVGQRVCCSDGTLPDIRPKPTDGKCFKYLVVKGDSCSTIAASNGLTVDDIEGFNKGTTWGWYGCSRLLFDTYICLSDGRPPMPFPIPNAVCGPTKPGSSPPTGHHTLLEVSPCPLNACCNVWGQCGISGDFCIEKRSELGNPGTSGLQNGCVQNCGMDIVKSDITPSRPFGRVGYYETWNLNRSCLHMFADSINADSSYNYTTIHWAFAEINTADWTVVIKDDFNQWSGFKSLKNVNRVISFGGWGYSTEPETYNILRQAMHPDNRETFAQNVANFVSREGIEGVDFDWEYPGATDIDGTPPGFETDGPFYLRFLQIMRRKLADGKTLSIAAPASFWYLKNFPIKGMAEFLDYIVYMTYDLHGQWDYTPPGKKSNIEACDVGNCIRSHGVSSPRC